MKPENKQLEVLQKFMVKGEESYIFACQASVLLIFTSDLLYHLWNNFKQYQYEFEPNKSHKISHIAVSDLMLSPFCKKVGFELYEMEGDARDILLNELVTNIGEKRKYAIARFLEDYAQLEHRYSNRKGLKNIHLLTAKSILDPSEMERQLIQFINDAKTDIEKLNYLMLHRSLLPAGFASELADISAGINNGDASFSPILIAEPDASAPGVLNVKLPSTLKNRIKRIAKPVLPLPEGTNALAEQLILDCFNTKNTYLDLGRCGLSDEDFNDSSALEISLSLCTHLEVLILGNHWFTLDAESAFIKSSNAGDKNIFTKLPRVLKTLTQLNKLIFCGGSNANWSVSDMGSIAPLKKLTYLDISYNNVSDLSFLEHLTGITSLNLSSNFFDDLSFLKSLVNLEHLSMRENVISDISHLASLVNLQRLHLQFNYISDLSPLAKLSELRELWCKNNLVTDLAPLSQLSNLEKLGLWSNKIQDIAPLAGLTGIKVLNLGANQIKYIPAEFTNFPIPILVEERLSNSEKEGIYVYGNPLVSPSLDVISRGQEAIKRYFKKFYSKWEVLNLINHHKSRDVDELSQEALLIFTTDEQQTWLVVTNKNIFWFLDDKDTVKEKIFIQKKMLLSNALTGITVEEKTKKNYGVISIGGEENWLYSLHLFKSPADLKNAVEALITVGLGKESTPDLLSSNGFKSVSIFLFMSSDLDAEKNELETFINLKKKQLLEYDVELILQTCENLSDNLSLKRLRAAYEASSSNDFMVMGVINIATHLSDGMKVIFEKFSKKGTVKYVYVKNESERDLTLFDDYTRTRALNDDSRRQQPVVKEFKSLLELTSQFEKELQKITAFDDLKNRGAFNSTSIKRIFISYSWKNERLAALFKDVLARELSVLGREKVVLWSESNLQAGRDFEKEVSHQLKIADIAVILISDEYMNTQYCVDQMNMIFAQRKIVLPVVIKYNVSLDLKKLTNLNFFIPDKKNSLIAFNDFVLNKRKEVLTTDYILHEYMKNLVIEIENRIQLNVLQNFDTSLDIQRIFPKKIVNPAPANISVDKKKAPAKNRVWFYPVDEPIDSYTDKIKDFLLFKFEIQKKVDSKLKTSFIVKAPKNMTLGNLYYHFINDYHETTRRDIIDYKDINEVPYQWRFRRKSKWYQSEKFFDPELTINENEILENSIIICERIGVDE